MAPFGPTAMREIPSHAPPRFSSCPTARSDSVQQLPHGPLLLPSCAQTTRAHLVIHVLGSPVEPVCDSRAALSSAAATPLLADSRTPASLRTPSRSVRRTFGPLGCHADA